MAELLELLPQPESLVVAFPKEVRLLEDLYCETILDVAQLVYTNEMDQLHLNFVRATNLNVSIRTLYLTLLALERTGRLNGKVRCLKCQRLRAKVVAYLCDSCQTMIWGGLPPPSGVTSSSTAVLGVCGVQTGWNPARSEYGSPAMENAIRLMEEVPDLQPIVPHDGMQMHRTRN